LAQATEFEAAWAYAIEVGYPPNFFLSINWTLAPGTEDPFDRLAGLRDRAKAWLRRHASGVPPVWLSVREKDRRYGEHAHVVYHVPPPLSACFEAALRRWVKNDVLTYEDAAVDVKRVWGWRGLCRYFLKGGDEEVQHRYGTQRFGHGTQGIIFGPRLQVAHFIGRKARATSHEPG
jgi:hypothetical protein